MRLAAEAAAAPEVVAVAWGVAAALEVTSPLLEATAAVMEAILVKAEPRKTGGGGGGGFGSSDNGAGSYGGGQSNGLGGSSDFYCYSGVR